MATHSFVKTCSENSGRFDSMVSTRQRAISRTALMLETLLGVWC
jgi:hypothetical protein